MKPLLSFCSIVFMASLFVLTACSKDDDGVKPESTDSFIGKWKVVEATGSFAEANEGVVYEFKEDGTLTITSGFSTSGTYTRTDTELTYTISGIALSWTYTLSGKTMTWDNKTADQNFILEKQ